jgi:hypothetical protein
MAPDLASRPRPKAMSAGAEQVTTTELLEVVFTPPCDSPERQRIVGVPAFPTASV